MGHVNAYATRQCEFSPDRLYRYVLCIEWKPSLPTMFVCMLNPSTADEFKNDPTIERMERRARKNGFGTLWVLNAFAYRATDPHELYDLDDPIGPGNDYWLTHAAWMARRPGSLFLVGWGTHVESVRKGRTQEILDILSANNCTPHALKINKDGSPSHPLYLPYTQVPFPYVQGGTK